MLLDLVLLSIMEATSLLVLDSSKSTVSVASLLSVFTAGSLTFHSHILFRLCLSDPLTDEDFILVLSCFLLSMTKFPIPSSDFFFFFFVNLVSRLK